jgi:hypothetical protein
MSGQVRRGQPVLAGVTQMVAKRIGRPFKPAIGAARVALGLKVTGETKRMVEALARASGRTQSQQAEYLIERALQYDQIAKAMGTTLESFEQDSIEAALRRKGWRLVRVSDQNGNSTDLWAPPGHPLSR